MSILKTITDYKTLEVTARKKAFPLSLIQQSTYYNRRCVSISESIKKGSGIIAEHKRKSPSKGLINDSALVPEVIKGYEMAGVSAISVLTDTKFFGGSLEDLLLARTITNIPLLRKEFIVDSYQIYEAKAYGADAILLIAACLTKLQVQEYAAIAKQIGLEVLVEVHNESELDIAINDNVQMLGVNNRNLKTFEVSIETSKELVSKIPDIFVKLSESGISTVEAIKALKEYGYQGFLMGEHFMKTDNPGKAAEDFIHNIKNS